MLFCFICIIPSHDNNIGSIMHSYSDSEITLMDKACDTKQYLNTSPSVYLIKFLCSNLSCITMTVNIDCIIYYVLGKNSINLGRSVL